MKLCFIGFVAQKTSRALLTVFFIVTLVFIVLRLAGDPATVLLGPEATVEMTNDLSIKLGLDQPIWHQYSIYLSNVLRGDLGVSFLYNRDAMALVVESVPATLLLSASALALALLIGVPLGVLAASNRGGKLDRAAMMFAVFGYCVPNFFLAVILMLILSIHWSLLPTSGGSSLAHLVMPTITLGTSSAAVIARFTRSAMLETLGSRYMQAAESRNLRTMRLMVHHAFPNAAIPVVTVIGFMIGGMVGGSIITETVFAWPGIGRLFVSSVANRDIPVVQVIVLLSGVAMVATNLMIDILYGWLDPRIRLRRSRS